MAILVTGGAGYIGSHMVHELTDAGEAVVVLDNLSTGFRFLIPSHVPLIVGNTGDQELVADLIRRHRVESIIHFAASIVVPESVADPLGYYRNNTLNTALLLQAAVTAGMLWITSPSEDVLMNRIWLKALVPARQLRPYTTG